jgi:hypothetical protein
MLATVATHTPRRNRLSVCIFLELEQPANKAVRKDRNNRFLIFMMEYLNAKVRIFFKKSGGFVLRAS